MTRPSPSSAPALDASTLSDVALLRRLVGFDTTSRNSNLPLADFIADYLDRPGIRVARNPSLAGDKANLVVTVGPEVDPEERQGLVLSGHLDVVPAEEPEWRSDPFALLEEDDRLVGRGACDMKGFVALAVNAAARADRSRLRHPLALILTYDEEVGTLGARRFVESWPADRPLPRRTIIGEPTSLRAARMHKGHSQVRITFRGRSAHSGYPHLGKNAIEPAGPAITALAQLRREFEGERCPHGEHFGEIPFVALNLARLRAGSAINVVPDECVIELGFRVLPGMASRTVVERIRQTVAAATDEPFDFALVTDTPSFLLTEDNDFYRDLCRFLAQEETETVSFGTDAGWLHQAGFDCLVWGPGSIAVAHRPNEYLRRAELEQAAGLLEQLIARYCTAADDV